MARHVSEADRILSRAMAARDIDASPRKIESMRQAGLLEEARHRGLGRGGGSRSIRSLDELERAERMAKLLAECGSYADAVLVAFVRNEYPIAKDRLERAYQQSFGAVLKWIEKRSDPATSVIDTATTVGAKVARPFCKDRKFRLLREQARNVGLVDQLVPIHRALQDFDTDLILLTWIIGSGVVHQVGPVGRWAWVVRGCSAGFARGRLTLAGVVW